MTQEQETWLRATLAEELLDVFKRFQETYRESLTAAQLTAPGPILGHVSDSVMTTIKAMELGAE